MNKVKLQIKTKASVWSLASIVILSSATIWSAIQAYLLSEHNTALFIVWIIIVFLLSIVFIAIELSNWNKAIAWLFSILLIHFDISLIVMIFIGCWSEIGYDTLAINTTTIFLSLIVSIILLLVSKRLEGHSKLENVSALKKAVIIIGFVILILLTLPPIVGLLGITWGLYSEGCSNCVGDYSWGLYFAFGLWVSCIVFLNILLPSIVTLYWKGISRL
jgi:hypothetical protein